MIMLAYAFLSWWYGRGWAHAASSFVPRLQTVADAFSVPQLLKTLFAPWRRIITYPGGSIDDKAKAFADNLVSRAIGFVVRIIVILAAMMCLVLTAIVCLVEIITWPLLPIAVIGLPILGIVV